MEKTKLKISDLIKVLQEMEELYGSETEVLVDSNYLSRAEISSILFDLDDKTLLIRTNIILERLKKVSFSCPDCGYKVMSEEYMEGN